MVVPAVISGPRPLALLALLACGAAQAFKVAPVAEEATLKEAVMARSGHQRCLASAGQRVRVLGQPTDLAATSHADLWLIRVLDGACAGFEAAVPGPCLMDRAPTR